MSQNVLFVAMGAFVASFFVVPMFLGILRLFGFYVTVDERTCHVYTLFGSVVAVLDQPGIYSLWTKMGLKALLVGLLGQKRVVDMRLDQQYLRSQPVNSEEGAPMGIGIWYEMFVSDPVAFMFKNADPRGSLRANVANATVRCLSNMKLGTLLEDRHNLSRMVRGEVSPRSHEWGFQIGSTYIRKVHFRDGGMIHQIEEKVTNRLRQVTSAIKQDGANQVSIITSSADRQAAIEFAKAAALRPQIVGNALQLIAQDGEVFECLFEVLETQRLLEGHGRVVMLPPGTLRSASPLPALLATDSPLTAARPGGGYFDGNR